MQKRNFQAASIEYLSANLVKMLQKKNCLLIVILNEGLSFCLVVFLLKLSPLNWIL